MQKRTEITIETERFLVVSHKTNLWCSICATTLPMLTVDLAARIAGSTPLVIFRQVETGRLHLATSPGGRLLVCSSTLVVNKSEDAGTTHHINSTF